MVKFSVPGIKREVGGDLYSELTRERNSEVTDEGNDYACQVLLISVMIAIEKILE